MSGSISILPKRIPAHIGQVRTIVYQLFFRIQYTDVRRGIFEVRRPLGRAWWVAQSPLAAAWAAGFAWPLAWRSLGEQAWCSGFGARRAFAPCAPSLLEHLGGSDWVRVIIAFLTHLLSAGFPASGGAGSLFANFFIFCFLRKSVSAGGGRRKRIKPASSKRNRQAIVLSW